MHSKCIVQHTHTHTHTMTGLKTIAFYWFFLPTAHRSFSRNDCTLFQNAIALLFLFFFFYYFPLHCAAREIVGGKLFTQKLYTQTHTHIVMYTTRFIYAEGNLCFMYLCFLCCFFFKFSRLRMDEFIANPTFHPTKVQLNQKRGKWGKWFPNI